MKQIKECDGGGGIVINPGKRRRAADLKIGIAE